MAVVMFGFGKVQAMRSGVSTKTGKPWTMQSLLFAHFNPITKQELARFEVAFPKDFEPGKLASFNGWVLLHLEEYCKPDEFGQVKLIGFANKHMYAEPYNSAIHSYIAGLYARYETSDSLNISEMPSVFPSDAVSSNGVDSEMTTVSSNGKGVKSGMTVPSIPPLHP